MKRKLPKMNEAAWVLGVVLCALGVCLCTKADFGLSMIAAPSYVIFRKLTTVCAFFTQGRTEYLWQAFLLLVTCLVVRRFRLRYLLSFVTAFLFGMTLDGWLFLFGGGSPYVTMPGRILAFAAGTIITALSIALFFRTKLPLEVYELAVAEVAVRYKIMVDRAKLGNDVIFLILSVGLTLLLHRSFVGVGIGTVIITLVNSLLINLFGKLLDKTCDFSPRFPRLVSFLHPDD